jgi:hypothetical protein
MSGGRTNLAKRLIRDCAANAPAQLPALGRHSERASRSPGADIVAILDGDQPSVRRRRVGARMR